MQRFQGQMVDVAVIGSGAGGGPLALALSQAGARVVVFEKGPWYEPSDFVPDELETCRRDFFRPLADEGRVHLFGTNARPHRSVDAWISCCVGGGTVHMSGFFYRLHPEDFALASRYGAIRGAELVDWPLGYDDLAPYYDRVEREIGVSGSAGHNPYEPPRSGPFPFPPLRENPLARLVDAGAKRAGMHTFPTPRSIITEARPGRAACVHHKVCSSYGCDVGAKSSTLAAAIPQAVATGNCEVRAQCMVAGLTSQGDRVTSVRYFDAEGAPQEQEARIVVVAGSAIESARLLLNSKLGNHHVGRHLTFSTLAKGWAEYDRADLDPDQQPDADVRFLQRSMQDGYFLEEKAGGYDKGGTATFLLPHFNPIFTMERLAKRSRPALWGQALMSELRRQYREVREIEFEVFGEFLPNPGTYVSVSRQVKDKWGIPVAEVHLQPHPQAQRNARLVGDKALAVLRKAGARRAEMTEWGTTTLVLQHGTCRFGEDPRQSALDPSCRVHGLANVYVVDGSFMPTSGGVPSTWTIMANSFRVADHLIAGAGSAPGA